jgi:hypothetical protein
MTKTRAALASHTSAALRNETEMRSMTNDTTPMSNVDQRRIRAALRIIVLASLHAERVAREHIPDSDALDELQGYIALIRDAAAIAGAELDGFESQLIAETVTHLNAHEVVRLFAEHHAAFFAKVAIAVANAAADRALCDIRPGRKPGPAIEEEKLQAALDYYERNAGCITLEEAATRHCIAPRTLSRYRSQRRKQANNQ